MSEEDPSYVKLGDWLGIHAVGVACLGVRGVLLYWVWPYANFILQVPPFRSVWECIALLAVLRLMFPGLSR